MQIPKEKLIILIVGFILAIVAVIMLNVFLTKQRQMMKEEAERKVEEERKNQEPVMLATRDIPKGVTLESDSLEMSMVPKQFVQPGAVRSLDRVADMLTLAPIAKGEQVTFSKLKRPDQKGDSLAGLTPVGKRAVSIAVDDISALGGLIKPGDYVDVIVIIPMPGATMDGKQALQATVLPLFQNILVLAVGRDLGIPQPVSRYGKEEKVLEQNRLINLALTPEEASLLTFVQEQGKMRLVLRSPADAQIEQISPASWDALLRYALPSVYSAIYQSQEGVEYIEIYRGLSKERMPLSE
ncbi:MAG: Flp pilus assembly protein CpaB [Candidatus Omnitrophota bacterium]